MAQADTSAIRRLVDEVLTHPVEEQAAYLADACFGNEALRREVEALLAARVRRDGPAIPLAFAGTSRFELRRCLGQGGFGTVYEALDHERGVAVALKLLRATDPAALYHFKREFRTLADLSHPNLIALNELFSEDPHWFFTMELVDGRPIVEFVRATAGDDAGAARVFGAGAAEATRTVADGPMATASGPTGADLGRLRHVFAQLVDGLSAIHLQDIVHRDVKPSNVLVTPDARVVLLDFGIATQLLAGDASIATVAGTPAYMAPEQVVAGRAASAASDWYSVGVMLYEALTGRLPFAAEGMDLLLAKQQAPTPPDDDGGAPELMQMSIALMDPDPGRRPTGHELAQVLGATGTTRRGAISLGTAVLRAPDLIGRETHLRALMAAYERADNGESVAVFVPGPSGTGKSALLQRFVADVRERGEGAIVFTARCHERESVPYKAVDGLVDGIAQYLRRLPAIEVARVLPRDVSLVARLFPVLLRVAEIERAPSRGAGADAVDVRRRGAAALRELLARIADRAPLVLVIDDMQWGDLDSGALLQEITRLPDAPSLLLLMAYRAEDAHAPLVRLLRDALLADAGSRDVRTLHVETLTPEQALALARRELAVHAHIPPERSAEIARESKGNSFFVHELVRHAVTVGGSVRLESVIRDRLAALPGSAQRLLHAVALSAQPIPTAVAAAAAGIGDADDACRLLRVGRLIRTHEGGTRRELEPYHDRIRESIVSWLDSAGLVDWHGRLADAWDASGLARAETLVAHFQAAGNVSRMVFYAQRAAREAEEALAFLRAADYYRLLVQHDRSAEAGTWRLRLGDALANAGRGYEAARAYVDALPGAARDAAIELERRAAEQFIRAGYLSDASAVLGSLLPRVGVRPAATDLGAAVGLVVRRAALAVGGTSFRERDAAEIPVDLLRRIDVLWSIGAPLSLVDPARGGNLHLRGMRLVLRAGEPRRVVRALATLACSMAIGGVRHEPRAMRTLAQARELATRIGDPTAIAGTALAEGMCQKVWGRWAVARSLLEHAVEQLMPCPGVRWEIETGRTMLHDALFWMGEWQRLFAEIPARRQEAEECGDLYSATHVAVRLGAIAWLAADQPERARAEAIAGMARWPSGHFDLQHRWEVCSLTEADLYAGRAAEAWERLRLARPRLRWTLYVFQNARIEMRFLRARTALARAAGERAFLPVAAREAGRLEREDAPWAGALAALVRAATLVASTELAVPAFAAAESALAGTGMAHYAAAARYRRGQLLGGDAGRALIGDARAALALRGIVDPERMVNMLAPLPRATPS
jgi:tetratricopeptide (TPR) repeat protein